MHEFLNRIYAELLPAGCLITADFILVIIATAVDFCTGIIHSRRSGIPTTSGRLRKTVTKLVNYLSLGFSMLIVDIIILATVAVGRMNDVWSFTPLPLLTTLASVGITVIEAKSVSENIGTGNMIADLTSIADHISSSSLLRRFYSIFRRFSG